MINLKMLIESPQKNDNRNDLNNFNISIHNEDNPSNLEILKEIDKESFLDKFCMNYCLTLFN